jgi:hypothetical protein
LLTLCVIQHLLDQYASVSVLLLPRNSTASGISLVHCIPSHVRFVGQTSSPSVACLFNALRSGHRPEHETFLSLLDISAACAVQIVREEQSFACQSGNTRDCISVILGFSETSFLYVLKTDRSSISPLMFCPGQYPASKLSADSTGE